jgi:hypothetical protein
MGDFYSAGRLISREARKIIGKRSLTGATIEEIWQGTALTRPSPGGVQVEAVSTSAQDDAAIADRWDVTVGAAVAAGDVARITINASNFDYMVKNADTDAMVATGLRDAINSGSKSAYRIVPAGVMDLGDTFRVTIGATAYDHVCGAADTPAVVIGGLVAAINAGAGDPVYLAINAGTAMILLAKAGGVSAVPVSTVPVDPGTDATLTQTAIVTGRAASTDYSASVLAAAVTLTNAIPGPTADTVASSFPTDPGGDSTAVAVHTVTGGGGTGIRTLRIDYLDTNGVAQSETISLNGVTAATSTATDIESIIAVTAATVGSAGAAVGVVTVQGVGAGAVYAEIEAGGCVELAASYTVPAGRVGYLAGLCYSASVASELYVLSDCNPASGVIVPGATFVLAAIHAGAQSGHVAPEVKCGPLPAGARVWFAAVGAAGRVVFVAADVYAVPA